MTPPWFSKVLARYPRVAIVGAPRTGKSTLTSRVTDRPVLGTDDYQEMPWDDIPAAMIERSKTMGGSYVIEGVQTARAIRKGLQVDAIVVMQYPKVAQKPGQVAMGKGIMTVLAEAITLNPDVPVILEPR